MPMVVICRCKGPKAALAVGGTVDPDPGTSEPAEEPRTEGVDTGSDGKEAPGSDPPLGRLTRTGTRGVVPVAIQARSYRW